jgi:hypothetical protein
MTKPPGMCAYEPGGFVVPNYWMDEETSTLKSYWDVGRPCCP